jgi:4,5-dihydroxyphthalate decarboxylase
VSGRPVRLRTAFWNYDRTLPLMDGRVSIEGAELDVEVLRPEETFARAYQGDDAFDVCEVSFSNSVTAASLGNCPYLLIPAFLSRAFRHSSIFIRSDRGIGTPADLRGKTIGLQEYDMTAAVVVRGLLRDKYGVDAHEINWRVGDAERLKPLDFPTGTAPAKVCIKLRRPGISLEQGLLSGELDAVISLRIPSGFGMKGVPIDRLFRDPTRAEREWFRESAIFPIMHAVGIRRDIAAENPGLTRKVYEAFAAAKEIAISELEIIQAPKVTLPWPHAALAETRALMGEDPWPYGIGRNRHVLETQLRWSAQDGLQARPITLKEIFAPDCFGD